MTPPGQDRSIVEPALKGALEIYLGLGTENEKQLSRLALDLLEVAGTHPDVIVYLNKAAAQSLAEEHPWSR